MNKDKTKNPFSHVRKVRRARTDKNRLTIDCVLRIEKGRYIQGKKSQRHTAHPPINLSLAISEEDLHRLFAYKINYESDFSDQFFIILKDAVQQSQIGARGKHKGHETTLFWIKQQAGFLHTLFSLINDSDIKPAYFNDLIEKIPPDYRLYFRKGKGKGKGYDPVILTAYYLEKLYGSSKLAAMGLKPFCSNFASFYITYIYPERKASEALFSEILKPIVLRRSGVKYLCEKKRKIPYPFTDALARHADTVPCDKEGNAVDVGPIGKKNPHYKEALPELFEKIRQEALFQITF